MGADVEAPMPVKVCTTEDGRAVIEQAGASVVLTADQILAIINELHACYDYCAAWKESAREQDSANRR
jgi:hypothetical protein